MEKDKVVVFDLNKLSEISVDIIGVRQTGVDAVIIKEVGDFSTFYVPYTGAKTNVHLGSYNLYCNEVSSSKVSSDEGNITTLRITNLLINSDELIQNLNADKLDGYHAEDFVLSSTIGQPNGIAPLDDSGKISPSYLPSYVDDILEFNSFSEFPETGSTGVIYVALDTGKIYRWSGSQYVEIPTSVAHADFADNSDTLDGYHATDFALANHTHTFTSLTDTFNDYNGSAGKLLKVNSNESGIDLIAQGEGGGLDADTLDGKHYNDLYLDFSPINHNHDDLYASKNHTHSFNDLTDVVNYNGHSGKLLIVGNSQIEYIAQGHTTDDSGINADMIDSYHASQTPSANSIPVADNNGKIDVNWIPQSDGSGLDADKVDGYHYQDIVNNILSQIPSNVSSSIGGSPAIIRTSFTNYLYLNIGVYGNESGSISFSSSDNNSVIVFPIIVYKELNISSIGIYVSSLLNGSAIAYIGIYENEFSDGINKPSGLLGYNYLSLSINNIGMKIDSYSEILYPDRIYWVGLRIVCGTDVNLSINAFYQFHPVLGYDSSLHPINYLVYSYSNEYLPLDLSGSTPENYSSSNYVPVIYAITI